jgi:hypothetical protein
MSKNENLKKVLEKNEKSLMVRNGVNPFYKSEKSKA